MDPWQLLKRVLQCHENSLGNRSILKIKFNTSEKPIFVTNNHRFLVLDSTYPGGKLHKWKEIQDCTKTTCLSDDYSL